MVDSIALCEDVKSGVELKTSNVLWSILTSAHARRHARSYVLVSAHVRNPQLDGTHVIFYVVRKL